GRGRLYAYQSNGWATPSQQVECGPVGKTRGMGSTAPVAVIAPEPPAWGVPDEVPGMSGQRAEAQPGQQRSQYPHWSTALNPAVPADSLKEQIDQQQSRALPPKT